MLRLWEFLLLYIFLSSSSEFIQAIHTKVFVRMPKPNDIGLIFDLTVANNDDNGKKEKIEFTVRSEDTCSLNLTCGGLMKKAGRIVGGNFGFLDAGSSTTVSLIWPTVSLYNRVGSCPIKLSTVNLNDEPTQIRQILHFDTRLTTLDPDGNGLRSKKDYKDCRNFDLEYFKNCMPVDCEERYFGQRSYFNKTSQKCEEVPKCHGSHKIYDMHANICTGDSRHMVSEEDLLSIKHSFWTDDWKDARNFQSTSKDPWNDAQKSSSSIEGNLGDGQDNKQDKEQFTKKADSSSWTKQIMDGLLIVGGIIFLQAFTTLAIYLLICFLIFLVVTWISRCRLHPNSSNKEPINLCSPVDSDSLLIVTSSSLLSQR